MQEPQYRGDMAYIRTQASRAFDEFAGETISDRMLAAVAQRDRYREVLGRIAAGDWVERDPLEICHVAREALNGGCGVSEVTLTNDERLRVLSWAGFCAGSSKIYDEDLPLLEKLGARIDPATTELVVVE